MDRIEFIDSKIKQVGMGVLLLSLIAVCFTPSTLLFTRLENLFLPILLLVLLASRNIRVEGIFFPVLAAFFGLYLVSIFLNGEGLKDVFFAFRTLKILLFLILASQLLHENLSIIDRIIRGLFLMIGMVIMIEVFNPFGLRQVVFDFFTFHTTDNFFRNDSNRIIGTMRNPNDNGVLLTCFVAYFMSAYYYSKKNLNLILIVIGLVLVVLSQSRTSLIAVLGMGIPFILTFPITKRMVLSVVGAGFLVLVVMYLFKMNYMLELLSTNPMEITAFKARWRDWGYVIEVWNEHPIWGAGPFADTFTAAGYFDPDNEYLYVLGSRGVVGLVCYLILLIYPLILFWRKRKEVKHGLLAVLLSVAFILIAITNFSILNIRIGVVYAIMIGIPFSVLLYNGGSNKLNLMIPSLGSLIFKSK